MRGPQNPYSGIATPEFNISICDRLAGRDINQIDVQMGDGALFAGEDVRANQLAGDPFSNQRHAHAEPLVKTYSMDPQ